ncbi:nucleoside phosphorylase domain-containing protein [Thamnocephalis sphaerospora]|uniref:S-methyl-5'-thioadenosine phosphorylase n=1 Tax=Thamnocephalis sphaerospora TaxID=78915 RepID=A0A4P9XW16_9FUNG|nr:nucleoside phosphorylase domain-containing protein [Thamnocephalis sphaerospora]|eukprot:RKP10488.1 nucleoside phosphorylase domain-containing protein [Thamnocephalis sphaerospora]
MSQFTLDSFASDPVRIAVIGGSGLYKLDALEQLGTADVQTPWGTPSNPITIARLPTGQRVAFLARHGHTHSYNPSEVPFRANIAALKAIGVRIILAFSAVGSLREEIRPGDFVLPSQLIDRTKGIRPSTFFENGAASHAPFADPFYAKAADLVAREAAITVPNLKIHRDKTLICMEGPAFSTRAESNLYRAWGGDVINMSVVPEAKLAREAEIAYQMVCMSTDYDCWRVGGEDVTVQTVVETMTGNSRNAKQLLLTLLPALGETIATDAAVHVDEQEIKKQDRFFSDIDGCMRFACMTEPNAIPSETREKLHFILPQYY